MTDKLIADQRLSINDKLVSANGKFTLWMQPDSNLVLYHDAINANNAYWATNTLWLPQNERPTYVKMQTDAHFVMYDSNETPRWGSGTWGPAFIDPYIVLRDDGNLVIYHNGSQPIWASGGVDGAGAIPAAGYVAAAPDVNFAVDKCGRMPLVVSGSTDMGPPTQSALNADGVAYLVIEQRRKVVNDVVEHAFLQDLVNMGVWPGQVIQGKALLVGDIAPIGPLARQPGTIEVATDIMTNTPRRQTADIDHPDAAKANLFRRDLLTALNPTGSSGLLKVDVQRASTLREVGVKLGVTVKGSAFGVDANATLDQTHKQSTVVASIRQVFYNVTFTPKSPQAAGIWPADTGQGVTYADLESYMGVGNPPLYIDSVQYGRFICVTVQGAFSSSDITAALKVHWTAAVSGNVNLDVRTKEILENSTIKIYTLGVPGQGNFQTLADPLAELQQVYTNGLSLTLQNLGAPISFTCRHIADGTLAHVGLAAEYTQALSAKGVDINDQTFEVFDGPGGGLVDTSIPVNAGDTVKVSADGQVWSGVFGSGTHGPEGWPGHVADRGAPTKGQGTAYAHIIRFGNNNWIEAGRFWEGSPPPGGGGTLQLNINDNNPYNGDPNKRWTVHVDVKRAGAAAAGIYV